MANAERHQGGEANENHPPRPEECAHTSVKDERRGEIFCGRCGLVLRGEAITSVSPSPEDRAGYVSRDPWSWPRLGTVAPERVIERLDGKGKELNAAERKKFRRIAKTAWHFRPSRRRERTISNASALVGRIRRSVGLPEASEDQAISIYRRAAQAGLIQGRSARAFAAACVLASSRSMNVPRGLKEICRIADVNPRKVRRAISLLSSTFHLKWAPPDPWAFLPRLASKLGLSWAVERKAARLLTEAQEQGLRCSGSPMSIAAAALVLVTGGTISDADAARTLGIARRSVSRWRRRISRNLTSRT